MVGEQHSTRLNEDQLTHLGNFNDIQNKHQQITLMVQMNHPCHKSMMVWGSPSISCEVNTSWVFLVKIYKYSSHCIECQTHLKNFINLFATLLNQNFNVMSHCCRGWNRCTRAPHLHQVTKFTILHKVHWMVTLSTPPGNMGPE